MKVPALLLALCAAVALASIAAAATHHSSRVVTTAKNSTLGETTLATTNGRTLYSLSAERNGRFICTNKACLAFWKPLRIAANITPAGAPHLGTIKRPDGGLQVTYKGGPLYAFAADNQRGDAKGEGFKDVGVWHAAAVGSAAKQPAASSSGPGGGYGYTP